MRNRSKNYKCKFTRVIVSNIFMEHIRKDFELGSDIQNKKNMKSADSLWATKETTIDGKKKQIISILLLFFLD